MKSNNYDKWKNLLFCFDAPLIYHIGQNDAIKFAYNHSIGAVLCVAIAVAS